MTRFTLTDIIEGLVGFPVPERGVNAMIRCPLPTHPERHPSFSINLDKGLWVCHSCGEKGGLQKLARLMEQEVDESDIEVRRALDAARSAGYEEPVDHWAIARRYQFREGDTIPDVVKDFARSKGISKAALLQYEVGYDPAKNRLVWPYWDDGKCVAVKYRNFGKEGTKWAKTSETGSRAAILGADHVRGARFVFMCEGESDTLAVWSYLNKHGMLEGVAVGGLPGTSAASLDRWELWSLDLLWAEKVFIAFDADAAGDKASSHAERVLGDKVVRVRPPDGCDMSAYLSGGGKMSALGLSREKLAA